MRARPHPIMETARQRASPLCNEPGANRGSESCAAGRGVGGSTCPAALYRPTLRRTEAREPGREPGSQGCQSSILHPPSAARPHRGWTDLLAWKRDISSSRPSGLAESTAVPVYSAQPLFPQAVEPTSSLISLRLPLFPLTTPSLSPPNPYARVSVCVSRTSKAVTREFYPGKRDRARHFAPGIPISATSTVSRPSGQAPAPPHHPVGRLFPTALASFYWQDPRATLSASQLLGRPSHPRSNLR